MKILVAATGELLTLSEQGLTLVGTHTGTPFASGYVSEMRGVDSLGFMLDQIADRLADVPLGTEMLVGGGRLYRAKEEVR